MPPASTGAKGLAPKVPQITLLFWIVKVLTTGMGESMSDFMGQKSVPIAGAVGVLGFALAVRLQLRAKSYSAPVYWFAVMMVAVFGTMVADGIKDGLGLSYAVTTPVFALAVAAVFWRWSAARARSRSTASPRAGASASTGPRCWGRSRSVPPRET